MFLSERRPTFILIGQFSIFYFFLCTGTLCPADLNGLRNWVLEYDLDEEEKLTPAGEKELQDLGERYVQRLPDLLGYDYNEDRYEFRFTTASRTEKSCKAFARGVFGSEAESSIDYPEPIESDPLLLVNLFFPFIH